MELLTQSFLKRVEIEDIEGEQFVIACSKEGFAPIFVAGTVSRDYGQLADVLYFRNLLLITDGSIDYASRHGFQAEMYDLYLVDGENDEVKDLILEQTRKVNAVPIPKTVRELFNLQYRLGI